jgi:putative NIF3 family GTP cyclohydrolase 1 type 2
MHTLTRREFSATAAAGLVTPGLVHAQPQRPAGRLTAGEVVARVKKNIGIPWIESSRRDTFKIGGPDTPVTGICATFGTNLLLMHKAQKAGLNMIVTHEPTFWSDYDVVDLVKTDEIYRVKTEFAKANGMVVWRIHDNWHAHKPDGIRLGFGEAIGWNGYAVPGHQADGWGRWDIPQTTLGELARYVAKVLDTRSVRVVGDPSLPVVKVAYGGHSLDNNMQPLPSVDCLLVSEAREYDSFEYVRDTVQSGARKGAIFISHVSGEDEGMHEFARWLAAMVSEVPIQYIPTTDEFWTV